MEELMNIREVCKVPGVPPGTVIDLVAAGDLPAYRQEAWLITTSSFTRSAKEAAKGTGVRLIDGKELADWMRSLKDES